MKGMIKYLQQNNVSLTKVHYIMGSMFGSMSDVCHGQKGLCILFATRSQRTRWMMIEKKMMEIFNDMHAKDPGFQFSMELHKRGRIRTLMWCSGGGHEQYDFW